MRARLRRMTSAARATLRPATRLRLIWSFAAGSSLTAIALAAPLAAEWVRTHPYFRVDVITVAPTERIPAGDLLRFAGLRPGMSIWNVDPSELEARLESHRWVRRATVKRELPRGLAVRIAEWQPRGVVLLDDLHYVDASGVVLGVVGPRDPIDLPFISGVEAAILADDLPYVRHTVRHALRLIEQMQAAGLSFRVSEVHIDREQGITIFPVEPRVAVAFGWRRFPEKIARLAEVMRTLRGREAQVRAVDLTYEGQAVIRVRAGASGRGSV
jgi:cell division protein FtsQ